MADDKKSRVGRFMPTSEDTDKTVSDITGQNATPTNKKKGKGRPKATHGKKRFTTLLEEEYIETIKVISNVTDVEQNELYSLAVRNFIAHFKSKYPDKYKLVQLNLKVRAKTAKK